MNWTAVVWLSTASVCMTLAGVHAVMWLKDRAEKANLAFSVLAVAVAAFTWYSRQMSTAPTPELFAAALWYLHWAIFAMVASLAAFTMFHFRTARRWLGHAAWVLQAVALAVSIVRVPSFDYDVIMAMRPVHFLGEQVYVAEGVTSGWHWFGQISFMLLLVFVADAAYSLWRRGDAGERRRALVIGVPCAVFVLAAAGYAALVFARVIVDAPHIEFVAFLGVVCAIGNELSSEVLRAARLTRDLAKSEAALRTSEGAARELSGRLITAQEDERKRLARDLHDDINQRLSLLSVELQILARDQPPALHAELERLASSSRQLSTDVHGLAYHLHPAKLEQLGLETTARSWCRDVGQQSGIRIAFETSGVTPHLRADVALCLFRILQEALHNVVRHSQAEEARVTLVQRDGAIRLDVHDTGRGFAGEGGAGGGLGLRSMRERARLVNGTLQVQSQPGDGARVTAIVPVS